MIVGEILVDLYFNPENVDKQGRPTFKNLPVMDKIITRPALPITMNRTKIVTAKRRTVLRHQVSPTRTKTNKDSGMPLLFAKECLSSIP